MGPTLIKSFEMIFIFQHIITALLSDYVMMVDVADGSDMQQAKQINSQTLMIRMGRSNKK